MRVFKGILSLTVLASACVVAHAQSTVGELLEKGGKQVSKADWLESTPLRMQTKWPNGQGEEELLFSDDGKISGTGHHYGSRSDSPASGQWKVEEDGKVCTPKTFTAWNSSTNLCWYFFKLGDSFYGAPKTEPGSRIGKINTWEKVAKQ